MKDWRKKQTHKLKEMKAENREGNTNKNKLKKRKLENVQERNMKKAIKRNTNLKRDRQNECLKDRGKKEIHGKQGTEERRIGKRGNKKDKERKTD